MAVQLLYNNWEELHWEQCQIVSLFERKKINMELIKEEKLKAQHYIPTITEQKNFLQIIHRLREKLLSNVQMVFCLLRDTNDLKNLFLILFFVILFVFIFM